MTVNPNKCGGGLYPTHQFSGKKPGDIAECPICGKPVKLRVPFNQGHGYWYQVPRHNAMTKKLSDYAEEIKNLEDHFGPEELDPELAEYVETTDIFPVLRHPLVYSVPYSPMLNKQMNKVLAHKRQRISELEAVGKFGSIMALYERPYRLSALMEYAPRMENEEYWEALGWIWSDTENFHQNEELWVLALTDPRPGKGKMMNKKDLAMLNALPDEVTIYRGQTKGYALGWSWTTSLETAEWFAKRFSNKDGVVITATVKRTSILACITGRDESEVVVNPESVQLAAKRRLK